MEAAAFNPAGIVPIVASAPSAISKFAVLTAIVGRIPDVAAALADSDDFCTDIGRIIVDGTFAEKEAAVKLLRQMVSAVPAVADRDAIVDAAANCWAIVESEGSGRIVNVLLMYCDIIDREKVTQRNRITEIARAAADLDGSGDERIETLRSLIAEKVG
jgi:hypothetical protein